MGVRTGLGLKAAQWFTRGVQLACAAIVLGIYSYFLATLGSNKLPIANSTRAVEGIAGAAAFYSLSALLFLCCLAGFAVTSALAVLLDTAFIAAFIYIAVANRRGAGACKDYTDTPLGAGGAASLLSDNDDDVLISLPLLCTACRLQTAALIAAIMAILFYIFSIFIEIALVRNRRREARYGSDPNASAAGAGRNNCDKDAGDLECRDFNVLPEHVHPDQVRSSHEADSIDPAYAKFETGYGNHGQTLNTTPYHYDDGVYNRPH